MDSLNKTTRMNLLIDLYGDLLTEKQLNYMQLYYCEDLSLAEIAESLDISRNAVHDNIKRAVRTLEEYEDKLQLVSKHLERKKLIEQIEEHESMERSDLFNYLEKLRDL